MKWPLAKFAEVALPGKGAIVSGPFGSNIGSRFFVEEGVPVIRGNNLTFGERRFIDDGFVYLTEEKAREFKNCEAVAGDLVFTAAGTIGQVGIIPPDTRFDRYVISNKQLRVRCDQTKVRPLFLFLWFTTEYMRQHIINQNRGCSIPLINLGTLRNLPVPLPPLEVQESVAATVSAYDELMENNRRRMGLLEEAARLLYREWFVRLRFPGHERTRLTNGLPAGWRKVPLGSITTKIGSGATPRGGDAAYLSEGLTLIRSMNVYDDRFEDAGLAFISEEQASALNGVSVQSRDILLNITGASVARCCMAPDRYLPARVNQHVMIVRADPAKADPFLVHAAINSDERKRQLLSYARKGSTREALTKDTISAFEITLPSEGLIRQFGEIAETCFRQRENLALQNQKLRAARDLLLPRLMSGEIAL